MTTLNERTYEGDIVKFEAQNRYSREAITIGTAVALVIGQVLGQAVTGGFTVADAVKTGTGNGTITQSGTPASRYGDDVMPGIYKAVCIAAAANAGTFRVTAPNGAVIGDATVGVAFASSHINFTINDGATDFIVGDSIVFTVDQTAKGKWYKYDPTATDGRQIAAGVLLKDAAGAASADVTSVALTRLANIETSRLVWPAGFTAAQISTGLAQLEARGIKNAKGV